MPPILTSKYRNVLATQVLSSIVANATSAYVFVGRPQAWVDAANGSVNDSNPPAPVDTFQNTDYEYWRDMLGAKRVTASNTKLVVRRINWTSGTVYEQYDDLSGTLIGSDFYVLDTSATPFKVYKCLWNNHRAVSTTAPNVIGTALTPQATADGYVWQYMYTILSDTYSFLTESWMPLLSNSAVQANALTNSGKLPVTVPLVVTSGGLGYSALNPITTTLAGDGLGATVGSTGVAITGGIVTNVSLATGGLGYTRVATINVYQSGASVQAAVRAIIPPFPNHGYDPVKELSDCALMMIVGLSGAESGKLTINNNYRRVGLIINPKDVSGNVATADFYRQTTNISISANTGVLVPDDVVTDITKASAPTAIVVDVAVDSNTNYVVRLTSVNPKGETTPFSNNDTLRCVASGVEVTVANTTVPELSVFSGDIVYVNQRTPITRNTNQVENIKLVFSFN